MGGEPKVGKSLLVANPALARASGKDRAGFTVPAVRLKIDCDVTLTEVASGLYRMLGRRIAGYESAHSRQLFRHFLNTPAEVEITGNRVAVRLPPRCGGVTECDRKVTLHATQARHRTIGAAMLQQCQGLRELHLVMEFREANQVPAAATAVAVEKVLVGIHPEAWLVVSMQRAQPHPSATAEWPRRVPIMRLQIAHQGNLLF